MRQRRQVRGSQCPKATAAAVGHFSGALKTQQLIKGGALKTQQLIKGVVTSLLAAPRNNEERLSPVW